MSTGEIMMFARMRFWVAAALAGLLGSLLAWPASAAGARPGMRPGTVPGAQSAVAPVAWGHCPDDVLGEVPAADRERYRCAGYPVPIDYRRPAAGTLTLALMRRAAEDPAHRIGSLFLNPGGPGGPGFAMPIEVAAALPAAVRQRFDLVGFDPRGVGRSAPLRCFTSQEDADAVLARMVAVPVTRTEITGTVRAGRDYTRACAAVAGPLLRHMSTQEVARDLDRLRAAVGDERLNYLGFSYGTLLGATYVNLFPQRVRAVVLDGNVDPALRTTDGLEYLHRRAAGMEAVLDAYLRRCAEAGPACAFSTGDPAAKFAEIRARLRRQGPVTLPGFGEVSLSTFVLGVSGLLYDPEDYGDLASILQSLYEIVHPTAGAATGAGPAVRSALPAFSGAVRRGLLDTPYTDDDSGLGVNCTDEPFPSDPAAYPRAARRWERESPTVGRGHAFSQVACASWPVPRPLRYRGPWNRITAQPVLLFGNYDDPATNYGFNQRMAAELGSARLVSADAFGHTILGRSVCADAIAVRYLVDQVVPPAGVVCQPDRQPFE